LTAAGIKLYAVSYDDPEALSAYVDASGVEFPLLSDVNSDVIRRYDVLNTIVQPEEAPFYGIPFPGFFLLNEEGIIVDKLFNRHLAHREGIEAILDSFAGRIAPSDNEPTASIAESDGIRVSAFLRGGGGILRVGPRRRLVVRIDIPEGLHIYDEPVPTGMTSTTITIDGPDGFRHEPVEKPPTYGFDLPGVDEPLQVWDGTADFVFPVYAASTLGRAVEEGVASIGVEITVRYQACDEAQCFIPRTQTLHLEVPIGLGAMPNLGEMHGITGQTVEMDSMAHMKRLVERKRTA
jgi:hypothetical protein